MLEIKDHVAVITGGGSGIGEMVAKEWVKLGGKVVLGDVVKENLDRVEKEIRDMGGQATSIVCDVTKEEDASALAKKAVDTFGDINLVVPCAGIIMDGLFLSPDRETGKVTKKMSVDQFQRVLDINITGVFLTLRECAEQMINNGSRGFLCTISSTGLPGYGRPNQLFRNQSGHECHAQCYRGRVFQKRYRRSNPLRCNRSRVCGHRHGKGHESESPRQDPGKCAHRALDRTGGGGFPHF